MVRFFHSIAGKLTLLAVLIISSFTAITAVTGMSFMRVEALLKQVVSDEITGVISNAQTGRRISLLLSDIDRLSRLCSGSSFNEEEFFAARNELSLIAATTNDPVLEKSFATFRSSAETLLDSCKQQNIGLTALRSTEEQAEFQLTQLENAIGELLVQQTLSGKPTTHLDQSMVLVAGIRESLLKVHKYKADQILFGSKMKAANGGAIQLVDDMRLQLQTLIASTPDMARYEQALQQNLKDYRAGLVTYLNTHQALTSSLAALRDQEQQVLTDMHTLDAAAYRRSAAVQDDIDHLSRETRVQLILFSVVIGILTLFLVLRINKRNIKRPMDAVLTLIQSIKQRHMLEAPSPRSDEWGVIQAQLIDMSQALDASQQELITSRDRLEIAMRGANDGMWDWNLETNEVYYSPRWKSMLGYADSELANSFDTWANLVDPEQKPQVLALVKTYSQAPEKSSFYAEFRMKHKQGYWVEILSRAKLVKDPQGKIASPRRLVGTHVDITDRKLAEDVLKQSELEQRSLIAALPDIIMRFDQSARHLFISENISAVIGIKAEACIGKSHRELGFDAALCDEFETYIGRTFDESRAQETEFELESITGRKVFNLKLTPDLAEGGEVRSVLAVARDITLLKEHQEQLEHIAHYDVLTGLPNRIMLADRLQQMILQSIRRNSSLGIVYIDLDGFKEVNDTYGHDAGDVLLKILARRMQQALRDGDTLARLGGDEFVAVIGDLSNNTDADEVLYRLLKEVRRDVHDSGFVTSVSASLGVTFYPQEEDIDADQLLRQADQAMYQAKLSGKNRFHVFDRALDRAVRGSHEIIERIRTGLDRGEFELFYQPKVNMSTSQITGVEALIRWRNPELGLLQPDRFLPVIEQHPLIVQLDFWVINQALEQARRWQDDGINLPVSINISATSLQHSDFVRSLKVALEHCPQVPPQNMELEILETAALEDIVHTSLILEHCLDLGVTIAIDDFGTGYSSLTYLKTLPVNALKIDQSFVRGLVDNPDDLAILEGVMGMAKAFRLEVIAEGVESSEHGQILLELGCELAQGYVISRPMPADEIARWAREWRSPFVTQASDDDTVKWVL